MTEIYGLFDAADPTDPDRVYTSAAFARLIKTMMRDGVVHNDGAELAVSPSVPAAMSVSVGTGMALIQGRYYINDAALPVPVAAADPSHPRIDRVVVQLEATPGRTVHAVVKQGTPAPSPVPPALTRTAETWELSLAQVRVNAGATSITAGNITDERGNASLCGVAAPVYVPSSQVEVVGAVDMQGATLTGLPVPSGATDAARRNMGGATLQNLGAPSASTDAARKADVDSAISGFGISQVAIDADKNWNNKAITNLGSLTSHGKTIINSSGEFAGGGVRYVLYPDSACAAANLCSQVLAENSIKVSSYGKIMELPPIPSSVAIPNVKHTVTVQWLTRIYGGSPRTGYTKVYVNGSPVGVEKSTSSTAYITVSDTIEVEPGDIISIWGKGNVPDSITTVYVGNLKVFAFAVPAGRRPQMW